MNVRAFKRKAFLEDDLQKMFEKWPQKWGSQQMDFEVFPNIKVVEQNSRHIPKYIYIYISSFLS